jgi:hypothetical protein
MQTTININGIETTITLTPEQVAQIQQASKPKLFEYEKHNTYCVSDLQIYERQVGDGLIIKRYGRYRRTKEAAEMDFNRQTRMFRLSALAWEVGECVEDGGYCVFKIPDGSRYSYGFTQSASAGEVYMTEETAKKVCEMLNSKEYVLDVE